MLVFVKVFPESKKETVVKTPKRLVIRVKPKAEGGKANIRTKELLSEYLGVPLAKITIKRGSNTPTKILEVMD